MQKSKAIKSSQGISVAITFVMLWLGLHEPRHDKTHKVTVRPAKTQISLGIRPVWSEASLYG